MVPRSEGNTSRVAAAASVDCDTRTTATTATGTSTIAGSHPARTRPGFTVLPPSEVVRDLGGHHVVAPEGSVEFTYAKPSGQRISGGAEAGAARLKLRTSGGELTQQEERAAKSRIAPEPNCMFEDAWAAAQHAGAAPNANLRMRYLWSDKHARPVWEVSSAEGEVLRRLDGVSCSILTR